MKRWAMAAWGLNPSSSGCSFPVQTRFPDQPIFGMPLGRWPLVMVFWCETIRNLDGLHSPSAFARWNFI
jgi:hypothetical protein